MEWVDSCLYLVQANQVVETPKGNYDSTVLVIGSLPDEFAKHFNAVLSFASDAPFGKIHNRIQEIFAEYSMIGQTSVALPEYALQGLSLSRTISCYMTDQSLTHYNLESALHPHGWLSSHHYRCLKLHVDPLNRNEHPLRFISERIVSLFAQDGTFVYEGNVVSFVNLDIFTGDEADFDNVFNQFLQDNSIKAGMSNWFSGFEAFRYYYTQAELALLVGSKIQPTACRHSFQNVVRPMLLDLCTERLPAHLICDPDVITLIKYDQQHGSELCNTLCSLLKNNINYTRTANELFIHRSTLAYRLDRIKQLIQIDYENIPSQWYLLLSFELMGIG
ncbi:MAG: helix-turn-helix domain-containing protein [Actinomycetia bacterium]|nr:helix-turn-helix domain-containing protein [Actinomycetes bacterium]